MQASKAYFMVRAQVTNPADREGFDRWYDTHHLPLAMKEFRAEKGWRFWSKVDPGVHVAVYRFADGTDVEAALKSDGFMELAADYDRTWPAGVTRTRDILHMVEERDPTLSARPRESGDPAT